jgi:integrase/recombinase XerD
VTRLRQMMLEELQRRNYSEATIRHYLRWVEQYARFFGRPPDKLGLDHLRISGRRTCSRHTSCVRAP